MIHEQWGRNVRKRHISFRSHAFHADMATGAGPRRPTVVFGCRAAPQTVCGHGLMDGLASRSRQGIMESLK